MALVCLDDFRAYAKRHLPKGTWDYFEGGADECATRDDNILAFKRIRLRPRVLKNVSTVDTRTTIQGTEISCPVSIAPTGFHCLAWPDGETSMARGAEAQGVCYVTSMYSTSSLTDIVAAAPSGLRWFQLYMHKDRQLVTELVREVEALGFRVLVLTVDTPVGGKRRADLRNSFGLPAHLSLQIIPEARQVGAGHQLPIADIDPSVCWEDVSWLRSLTRLPIVLKGILTREDAEQAVGRGVQGILVSNHGGRQLDGVLATVDAVTEVVSAVRGRAEVYLDGGVRTGSDVLKALALGARCVFVGRPALWGLAYKGEQGVEQVLRILKEEFRLAMALSGCRNVLEISRDLVQPHKL
ncbi:hydroxyacid oxidase 2 isoform X2 [Tachyglossus aculeatus]|uniref:hydroxyacid oxidase 2 isoform X2 n=1 Tax=Tachyglossus aculeatus TaxID=9261 RepID=UPI0018F79A09|nr:hydroxyacid oxidase 2 isoform X2 [Tachyglossus aculeatus]